jgi:PqqD family protein of HPr-rel-A system
MAINKPSLMVRDTHIMMVTGNSMTPLLNSGDHIYYQECHLGEIAPGDLLVLRAESGQLAVHRFVKATIGESQADERLLSQGDASVFKDNPWPHDALFGKVVGRVDIPADPATGEPNADASTPDLTAAMSLSIQQERGWTKQFAWWTMTLPFPSLALRLRRWVLPFGWEKPETISRSTPPSYKSSDKKTTKSKNQEEKSVNLTPTASFEASNTQTTRPRAVLHPPQIMLDESVWESQQLGGEWVLHHRQNGSVHVLNITAGYILQWTQERQSETEILAELKRTFPDAAEETLKKDLKNTVKQLTSLGLASP